MYTRTIHLFKLGRNANGIVVTVPSRVQGHQYNRWLSSPNPGERPARLKLKCLGSPQLRKMGARLPRCNPRLFPVTTQVRKMLRTPLTEA
jgi:hypothetical protein